MRYLCEIATSQPPDLAAGTWEQLLAREWTRGRRLQAEGKLIDIWRVASGEMANVSLWEASSEPELRRVLQTLPLARWQKVRIVPLLPHPMTLAKDATEGGDRRTGAKGSWRGNSAEEGFR